MGTEENPDIAILINGTDRTSDCKTFKVTNAGILKIPSAEITLFNKAGKYTTGTNVINLYDPVIIDVDVRGVTDRIFYGRVHTPTGRNFIPKSKAELLLECQAYPAQKLIRDKITYDYADEGARCVEAISDILANPDSGEDTGITLETDSGEILTKKFPENLDKDDLLEGLRLAAELLNYDGYWKGTDWSTLYFKKVGTDPTNPAITLNHPFIELEPKFSIDEIKNYILIWGSTDQGYPTVDDWCEKGIAHFPNAWCGIGYLSNGNPVTVTLSDDDQIYKEESYSIRCTSTNDDTQKLGARIDLGYTDYQQPQNPTRPSLNFSDDRFGAIQFYIRSNAADPQNCKTILYDELGTGMAKDNYTSLGQHGYWSRLIRHSVLTKDHGSWTHIGVPTFDWSKIRKIETYLDTGTYENKFLTGDFVNIDGLKAAGQNETINPIDHPTWAPPVKDDTSIGLYGRTLYHHEDENIKCYEDVISAGQRILSVNKNPFKQIKATKGAKTWAKPSQYLTFNLPEYGINSEQWRILQLEFEWNSATKRLSTAFTLVPKLYGLPTGTARMETLGGLLSEVRTR